uniref:G/T mismatch-specific thymine DNA glycosylase n=1 Tax=Zeugodacus cucurbitae TaxID=28588 RepID=A0A0A1XI26_ZEUCU
MRRHTPKKLLLRSSIAVVQTKETTLTEVGKRNCATERKLSLQDEDACCRNQSKRSSSNKNRKRTVQKLVKKLEPCSDCSETTSNDEHDEHTDGCENELFNADNSNSRDKHDAENMSNEQHDKQRLEIDTTSVLDYNDFGNITVNNSLKIRETTSDTPLQYTAGIFGNQGKEYTAGDRFQRDQQFNEHNETVDTAATTKTATAVQLTKQRQDLNQQQCVQQSATEDIENAGKQQHSNLHDFIAADERTPVAPYTTTIKNTQTTDAAARVPNYSYDLLNTPIDGQPPTKTTSAYVENDMKKSYGNTTVVSCWQQSNINCNLTGDESSANNVDDNENADSKSINCNKERQTYVGSQMQNMTNCNSQQQSMYIDEPASDSNSQQLAIVASTCRNLHEHRNCKEKMENICDVYDRVDSASTNAMERNYDEPQDGAAYIDKGVVDQYGSSIAESTSANKSTALPTVSTTATNVNNASDSTTSTISTTTINTMNTINTKITDGCVSTNVTINKIPNTDDTKSVATAAAAITTPATAVYDENTVGSCENGKHLEQVPSTNIANDNVLNASPYNLNQTQELPETLAETATSYVTPHSASDNLDNRNEPWAQTPNERYQRYSNSDNNFCQTAVDSGTASCLSAELCYKISDDASEEVLKIPHQQHAVNIQNVINSASDKDQQLQHANKNQHAGDYLTRQSIDAANTLNATDVYPTELQQLQQSSQRSQNIQHYMQEQLCQQMQQQQQRQQLHEHQQQELNQQHHHQHQQPYTHDTTQVLQQMSLHDYNLHHSHPHQLQPLHDVLRHNQHQSQHFEQHHRQLEQRHDEEQQQHLIAYLQHTSDQTRLHEQLQHHEYQQQQQFQQEQQLHHNHHQQQHQSLQPNLLLIAKKQQHQQPHISTDLKRINRPPPTSIDDLIIDEFSEDPHASYKLGLSPNHVKHENQDDGYETSAGDVLTPNSHSSSTHSVTPQHQMQQGINLIPQLKCDEQQMKIQQPLQHTAGDITCQQQQSPQHNTAGSLRGMGSTSHQSGETAGLDAKKNLPTERYSYVDEHIAGTTTEVSNANSSGNNRVINMPKDAQLNGETVKNSDATAASYMGSRANVIGHHVNEIYSIQNQNQQQQQHQNQPQQQQLHTSSSDLPPSVDYNLKSKLPSSTGNGVSDSEQLEQNVIHQNLHQQQQQLQLPQQSQTSNQFIFTENNAILRPPQKKRGRKKKIQPSTDNALPLALQLLPGNNECGIPSGGNGELSANCIADNTLMNSSENPATGLLKAKERKKHDRFNGMSEEEVVKRTLPDHLCDNLDIVIIGINPGLFAAYKGHHYAGPGNHFWKCLYLSGLTQEQMSAEQDYKLLKYGIGFTNMVQRATKGSADLTRKEIKEGSRILLEKLQRFRPKIAVFNGKLIFEVFSGKKDFNFGRQPECVEGTDTYVWVMPSSSARCAQLPRAADKVPFYAALKKFRDYLNGLIPHMDESECIFTEQKIKQVCEQENEKNSVPTTSAVGVFCGANNAIGIPRATDGMEIAYNNMSMRPMDDVERGIPTQHHRTGEIDNDISGLCVDTSNCTGCPNSVDDNGGGINRGEGNTMSDENCAIRQEQEKFPRFQAGSTDSTYIYRTNENERHNIATHTPGPGPTPPAGNTVMGAIMQQTNDNYMIAGNYGQPPPEKKKRGRPKKIKDQDLIDTAARNRMQIMGQMSNTNDFGNILNLSMMGGGVPGQCGNDALLGSAAIGMGNGNCETPKKKRGRPKKVKPTNDVNQMQNTLMQGKPHAMSIQSLSVMDSNLSQRMQQQVNALYSNKDMPQQQQQQQPSQQMYTSNSPMRSPALNCSYSGITPPTSTQSTPPTHQQHCDKLHENVSGIVGSPTNLGATQMDSGGNNSNSYYSSKQIGPGINSNSSEHHDVSTVSTPIAVTSNELVVNEMPVNATVQVSMAVSHETQLGESPPPSSPNICAVDFEPPTASTGLTNERGTEIHDQRATEIQAQTAIQQHQQLQHSTRYASPVNESAAEHQASEHYQQWMSPHAAMALSAQYAHHQPEHLQQQQQQPGLNFEEQQQQLHHLQQLQRREQSPTPMHEQWSRQQRYDDLVGGNYGIASPHLHHHQHQPRQQHIHHSNQQQQQHVNEHQHSHLTHHHSRLATDMSSKSLSGLESLVDQIPALSDNDSVSVSPVVGNSAVSAAVENRLQSLQQQQHQHMHQQQRHIVEGDSAVEMHADHYCTQNSTVPAVSETSDTIAGNNSSGSNTPLPVNGLYNSSSPRNYSIHRLNSSSASSPVMMSPHHHQTQQQQQQQRYMRPTHLALAHQQQLHTAGGALNATSPYSDSELETDFYKPTVPVSGKILKPPKHGEMEICPLSDALAKYKPLDKFKEKERESKNKLFAKFQVLTRYAGHSVTAAAAGCGADEQHGGSSSRKKDKEQLAAAIPQENLKRLISTTPATKVTRQKNKIIIQDATRKN